MNQITVNLNHVKQLIADEASAYGRAAGSVKLLAVSKRHPLEAIVEAVDAGQTHFGENVVDEAINKIERCGAALTWHFIGQIQSNKTRAIAQHFDWVHSVDRVKIATRLSDQRESDTPLNVCVQVRTGGGQHRGGVAIDEGLALAEQVHALPQLALRGLMILPPQEESIRAQRAHFKAVARLAAQGRAAGLPLDDLSMGMSGDWRAAIAEGATWVRLGTAVFGARPPRN
ncbi:MAG: YggS family pyridoxal phosphate-dependent enzyme [Pseudomonadota bacterium]